MFQIAYCTLFFEKGKQTYKTTAMSNIGSVATDEDGTEGGTMPGDVSGTHPTPGFLSSTPQHSFDLMNSVQKGFLMSIRALEKKEKIAGAVLLRAVSDMFTPASLFN